MECRLQAFEARKKLCLARNIPYRVFFVYRYTGQAKKVRMVAKWVRSGGCPGPAGKSRLRLAGREGG